MSLRACWCPSYLWGSLVPLPTPYTKVDLITHHKGSCGWRNPRISKVVPRFSWAPIPASFLEGSRDRFAHHTQAGKSRTSSKGSKKMVPFSNGPLRRTCCMLKIQVSNCQRKTELHIHCILSPKKFRSCRFCHLFNVLSSLLFSLFSPTLLSPSVFPPSLPPSWQVSEFPVGSSVSFWENRNIFYKWICLKLLLGPIAMGGQGRWI